MAGINSDAVGDDWMLRLPADCRLFVVGCMDSTTRSTWRTVCRIACRDVHAATRNLAWRGGDKRQLLNVPTPKTSPPPLAPTTVLSALAASLPCLHHLSCKGITALTTIQGIPATLRSLDLTGCAMLDSLAPLQYCTALERLVLSDGRSTLGPWRGLVETLPQAMSALGPHLKQLKLWVTSYADDAQVEAAACSLQPLTALTGLTCCLPVTQLTHWHVVAGAVAQMTDLRQLALRNSRLGGPSLALLAPAIQQLSQLRWLDVSMNWLTSQTTADLLQAIATLPPTLTRLDVGQAAFEAAISDALAAALSAHSATLTCLVLHGNSRRIDVVPALVPVRYCSALVDLDLSGFYRTFSTGSLLASVLSGVAPTLTSLNISNNHVRDKGAVALAPVLASFPGLVKLHCSDIGITRLGAAALAAALLPVAPSLVSLDLSHNHLGGAGAAALAPALSRMTALTSLECEHTRLQADGAVKLAPALRCMTALTHLSLTGNRLHAAGAAALACALPALCRLQHVRLIDTLVGVEGLMVLAQGFQALGRQQHWDLHAANGMCVNLASGSGKAAHWVLGRCEDAMAVKSIVKGVTCWELCPTESWGPSFTICGMEVML